MTSCVGVPAIVEEIRKRIRNSKSAAPPKNDQEQLDEFMHNEAMNGVKRTIDGKLDKNQDGDNDSDSGHDLGQMALNALDQRKQKGSNVYQHASQGANRNQGANSNQTNRIQHDQPAQGPSRTQVEDVRATYRDREDNVQTNNIKRNDPLSIAKKVSSGDKDDDMLNKILEKMGGDEY